MFPVPKDIEANPEFAAALALCEDCYIKPNELARHWRVSIGRLSNLRRNKRGCPFVKLGGSVRYRISDVLRYEAAGYQPTRPQDLKRSKKDGG